MTNRTRALMATMGLAGIAALGFPPDKLWDAADGRLNFPKDRPDRQPAPGHYKLGRRFWRGKGNQHTPSGRRKKA